MLTTCVKKASNQIRVLKRLSWNLDQGSRMQIFRSFILAHFKYCEIVYHFCGKGNTEILTTWKRSYRASKFVYNEFDVSYESLLEKANVCTLSTYRKKKFLLEVYKAVYNLSPPFIYVGFIKMKEPKLILDTIISYT